MQPKLRALLTFAQAVCLFLLSICALAQDAYIYTDKTDYLPGDTVIILGEGWIPGEEIKLEIVYSTDANVDTVINTSADVYGNIYVKQFVIEQRHTGESFTLSATGMISGLWAQTVFTDGANRWTGLIDNDWHKAGNWTGTQSVPATPTAEDDVVIPAGVVINISQTAYCKNINIEPSRTIDYVTLTASGSLQVSGVISLSRSTSSYGAKCILAGRITCDSLVLESSVSGSILTVEGTLAVLSGLRIGKPNNQNPDLLKKNILNINGEIAVGGNVVSEGDRLYRTTLIAFGKDGSLLIAGDYVSSGSDAETDMTSGGSLYIGKEWYNGSLYSFKHGTGTVLYNRNGDQAVTKNIYHNLILTGSGFKSISTSLVTVNNKLSMQGAAVTSAPPTYRPSAALEYKGDIDQTTGAEWTTAFQGEVIIDNASGVQLNGNREAMRLNLKNGLIKTNGYTLTVKYAGEGSITSGSAASYVDGKLSTVFASSFSRTYPIGKNGVYRPLIISFTKIQNIVGGCTITAEQIEERLSGELPLNTALFTGRYWTVSSGCPSTAFSYDISLDGTGFSLSGKPLVLKKDNSGITYKEAYLSGTVFTAKGFNSSGLFAIGEQVSASSITVESPEAITYGAGSVTLNAHVVIGTGGTPVNTGTVQFILNGVSIGTSEPVINGTASLTFNPSYLDAGAYMLMAVYSGDGTIKPSTTESDKVFVINKAPATIRLMDLEQTYDGSDKKVSVRTNPDGLSGVSIYYKVGEVLVSSPVEARSYKVEAALNNRNYKLVDDQGADLWQQTATLVINPRILSIAVNNKSKVYGTDNPALDGAVSGLVSSDGISVSYSATALTTSEVGEYPISATITDPNNKLGNYTVAKTDGKLTITPAPATIALSNTEQTYNGTPRFVTATVIPREAGAKVRYFEQGREVVEPIYAGQYEVEAELTSPNYEALPVNGMLEIAKAPTTAIVIASNATYDGTPHGGAAAVYIAAGLSQELKIQYTGTTRAGVPYSSYEPPTEAGEYIAAASYQESANYLGSSDTQPFVIAPAQATISVSDLSKVYNGSPQGAKITTMPNGLTVDVTYEGLYELPINAGSYAVMAVLNNSNFIAAEGTGTLVIDKVNQVINIAPLDGKTYGDAPFAVSATTSSGLGVGFSVVRGPVTIDGNTVTIIGAGEAVIRASQPGSDNYYPAADVDYSFKIGKAKAVITLGDLNHVYDGGEKAVAVTLSPVDLGGISITYQQGNVPVIAPVNAGNYEVTVNLDHINYEAETAAVMLVISKAPTTTKVTVGDVVYDGQPHGGSALVTGAANLGQELTVSYSGTTKAGEVFSGSEPPTQAGDYTATASFAGNDNYFGSSDSKSFVILKAVSTVTLEDVRVLFDGEPHAAVANVSGVDGEISNAPIMHTYTGTPNGAAANSYYSVEPPVAAGAYTVLATFAGNSNYEGSEVAAALIIEKVSPQIVWDLPAQVEILEGTDLADKLNAQAFFKEGISEGDFTYKVGESEVQEFTKLSANNMPYTLYASFIPKDKNNFIEAVGVKFIRVYAVPMIALSTPAPVQINSPSRITATLGRDVFKATWIYSIASPGSTGENGLEVLINSSAPNVYAVHMTYEDGLGNSYKSPAVYAVFYDPAAGFVTGGGWIHSPAGAYTPNEALTGKANFGFVSKYEKGKTIPTGNTEFQFQAGGMNFKSSEYEYLVVGGARAQFRGKGTINGGGSYGFMLSAVDENLLGSGTLDKFRIKIWDNNNEGKVIYDNQMGETEDVLPTITIGGGSIVIHTPGKKTNAIAADARAGEDIGSIQFSLRAFPNPSSANFNILVESDNAVDKVTLRILDLNGRVIEVIHNAVPGQTYNIGMTYKPGVYLVEMIQGTRHSQAMLLKLVE